MSFMRFFPALGAGITFSEGTSTTRHNLGSIEPEEFCCKNTRIPVATYSAEAVLKGFVFGKCSFMAPTTSLASFFIYASGRTEIVTPEISKADLSLAGTFWKL